MYFQKIFENFYRNKECSTISIEIYVFVNIDENIKNIYRNIK